MENKTFDKKKLYITISIVCAILIVAIVLFIIIADPFKSWSINSVGNTMGNIRNYGYAVSEGNKMFFISPNDDSNKVRVNVADLNGKNRKIIYETEYDLLSLNAYKGKLYCIGLKTLNEAKEYNATLSDNETKLDYVDNKIYSMNMDGTSIRTLNDNEFSNDCYQIYVVNDLIYYIGEDYNVYVMNLDGSDKRAISTNRTGFLGLNEKYILFNDYPEEQKVKINNGEVVSNPEYVTYIMNIDGTNPHQVDGSRYYSVSIIGDYIYYTDADKNICKIKVDGTDKQVLLSTSAYNMNVTNKKIYYLNYKDEVNNDYSVCIFRCNLDGTKNEAIQTLEKYSQFLDVIDEKVFYMDSQDNEGRIYLFNPGDKALEKLYAISYSTIDQGTTEDEHNHDDEYESDEYVDDELQDSHAQ